MALGLVKHTGIQDMTTSLQEYGKKIGLQINAKRLKPCRLDTIWKNAETVEGTDILDVQEFMHLGSKIGASGESDADVQARINIVASVFKRFRSI